MRAGPSVLPDDEIPGPNAEPMPSTEDCGWRRADAERRDRYKLILRLPKSVHARLVTQARLERRQMRAVIEWALQMFAQCEPCEPRPYIPTEYRAEERVETQIRISDEIATALDARALEEERTRNALVLRAILSYLDAKEGDAE